MASLKITLNDKVIEHKLEQPALTAGRVPGLDLTLPVREASREHFRLGRLKDGGWGIQDLGSTNGTLVNGERITMARLKDGDLIQIGQNCSIVFVDPPALPAKKKKKKASGPIVLKSRAQRLKEEKEEAALRRREARKAERSKHQAAPQPEPEPEDTVEIEEVPEEVLEIDSEGMLQKLLQDRERLDAVLEAGTKKILFGPYVLQKRLSQGGMGVVFKARHRKKRFDAALKILRTDMVDENNIARFKQEAWAISAFNHKNIVKVRDLAECAGMHYIAMDFIDGQDLLAVGFKRELTFWQTMEAIDKLADVLRLVHARNIWHRDIKPQNVLLDRKGEIRLIDFGIATIEREHDDATKTAEGLIMGTPAFLSPEQAARGKMGAIDGRADLYSLGAVMYYLLTGRRPFTGKTPIEILHANMKSPPPPPHTVEPMVPEGLEKICLRLLEKDPDDRYQDATELQAVLAEWRKSPDGRMELDRHKKIMKLRAMKAKRKQQRAT